MIKILQDKITHQELSSFCQAHFRTMVKFVADVSKGCLAIGGELHADAEALLLAQGSRQSDLWGGNFFPWNPPGERLEFTSLINIRPADDNPSMEICDQAIRYKVEALAERILLSKDETMEGTLE